MWSTHSEVKKMETLEFGVEKGVLQDHARWQVAHAPKVPVHFEGFQQSTFKGKVREGRGWLLQTS